MIDRPGPTRGRGSRGPETLGQFFPMIVNRGLESPAPTDTVIEAGGTWTDSLVHAVLLVKDNSDY